jgi:hypothetical protein
LPPVATTGFIKFQSSVVSTGYDTPEKRIDCVLRQASVFHARARIPDIA